MFFGRVVMGVAALAAAVFSAGASPAAPVLITITDARVAEGGPGRLLVFEVRANGGLEGSARVAFATREGSAFEGEDYTPLSGEISFDSSSRTRSVAVRVRGDGVDERDEMLAIALSRAGGAAIRDAHGVGTIADDDGPPLRGARLAAAGDIACDPESQGFDGGAGDGFRCRQRATSNLLLGRGYAAVLALGDNQYEDGGYEKFVASYGPSWGRVKSLTRPVPGNHEYGTPRAAAYFRYFGAAAGDPARGYYGFDVGAWHVVVLNSNCGAVGGCGAGSPQERWLRADLAATRATCTLAFWHHPRFSSGAHGSDPTYTAFWQALYEASAEVVLVGHDHDYERFAPQTARGGLALVRGIREFVVGTGGKGVRRFSTSRPNSEARSATTLGVLELTLGRDAYAWRFRAAVGSFRDRGSTACH